MNYLLSLIQMYSVKFRNDSLHSRQKSKSERRKYEYISFQHLQTELSLPPSRGFICTRNPPETTAGSHLTSTVSIRFRVENILNLQKSSTGRKHIHPHCLRTTLWLSYVERKTKIKLFPQLGSRYFLKKRRCIPTVGILLE